MLFGVAVYSVPQEVEAKPYLEPPAITETIKTPEPETLEKMAARIADEYKVSRETLFNLVYSESRWNPNATSTTGDFGLVQINLKHNPEVTLEQALDPEFSLRFAADKISQGKEYLWTPCSCIQTAKALGAKVSGNAKDVVPNTAYPHVGGVVIFKYPKNYHVAYIKKVSAEGIYVTEGNLKPCLISNRLIKWDDTHIIGYWNLMSYPPKTKEK